MANELNKGTLMHQAPGSLACDEEEGIGTQEELSDRAILAWEDQCKCMELSKRHLLGVIQGHMLAYEALSCLYSQVWILHHLNPAYTSTFADAWPWARFATAWLKGIASSRSTTASARTGCMIDYIKQVAKEPSWAGTCKGHDS